MLIATENSVYKLPSKSEKPRILLDKVEVRRVAEGERRDFVALSDGKIVINENNNQKRFFTGIRDRIDSLLIIDESPYKVLIGCTPPNLYTIKEGNGKTERNNSFDNLSVRSQWSTPWGGPPAVRSMAMTKDGWVYADIHVGSIMRSKDRGVNWEPVVPELHRDVHEVATSPSDSNLVYANTYLSVYVSYDRGNSWHHRSHILENRYGRGVTVNPDDPDTMLCGVSDGPMGSNVHGQLHWTSNAGETWIHVKEGYPDSTSKNIDTFHIIFQDEYTAWVTDEEHLYISEDRGLTWESFWDAPSEITMISCNV
jgi:hypothetical protein